MDRLTSKPILAWINAYGAWDATLRDPIEMRGYDQYLDALVNYLKNVNGQVKAVYFSGGMLDTKGRTECETVIPILKQRLAEYGIVVPIHADTESITSIGIAQKFVHTYLSTYANHQPLLFCDEVRVEVNTYAVQYFLDESGRPDISASSVVIGLPRQDIHPHSTIQHQQEKLTHMKQVGVMEADIALITSRMAENAAILRKIAASNGKT